MTPRGTSQPARRAARAAAPVLLAALALAGCSDDEPTVAPSGSGPTTSATSAGPSASTSPPSSGTAAPSGTAEPSGAATPTLPPAPSASGTAASCPAGKAGAVNVTGLSSAAAAKARALHTAAKACNGKALIAIATKDGTGFAGERPASATFTASSTQNYTWLATLLTMPQVATFDGSVAPRVFSEDFKENDAEWTAAVNAGLITSAQAADMKKTDGGYTGPRVGIAEDGTWTFFTHGR
ncbi:hypothetical protein [Knoellia remsis]|uniref:hypothetical protein n=1 Tax=Knoellia remsis TaxID=407159 RepID=UPI0011B20100|nr:hypothetical protein [Knoellia remsis]